MLFVVVSRCFLLFVCLFVWLYVGWLFFFLVCCFVGLFVGLLVPCKHIENTRDFRDFVENAGNGARCCLDSFSGRCRRGHLKFSSLGSPGGKVKKKHWKDPRGENRG